MINITDKAAQKFSQFAYGKIADGELGEHWALYFSIIGGGCAGYQHDVRLIESDDEANIMVNGIPVHVPEKAKELVREAGITIDWLDELMNSGFTVKSANAEKTCGCGKSFS